MSGHMSSLRPSILSSPYMAQFSSMCFTDRITLQIETTVLDNKLLWASLLCSIMSLGGKTLNGKQEEQEIRIMGTRMNETKY